MHAICKPFRHAVLLYIGSYRRKRATHSWNIITSPDYPLTHKTFCELRVVGGQDYNNPVTHFDPIQSGNKTAYKVNGWRRHHSVFTGAWRV